MKIADGVRVEFDSLCALMPHGRKLGLRKLGLAGGNLTRNKTPAFGGSTVRGLQGDIYTPDW